MKRILSLLICAMLIISSVGVVSFANDNHWSYDYIKGMISEGIISGDQNGNLNLDNSITRAEFAKTVNKYFGFTVKADLGFNDVTSDKWYYNDLLIAKGTGYMIGDANGNANADGKITRAEAFVIIARLLGLEDANDVTFTDEASIPSWAKGKIGALVKAGIVSGYTDGSINANGNITRAEAFVVVSKNERHSLPSDAPESADVAGNTSSMTHVAGNVGGGSSGGGGGGGISTPVAPTATVDLRAYNDKTFEVEYTATNFTKVVATLTFADASYDVDLVPVKSSGNNYKASLKDAVVDVVNARNSNGDAYTLSLKTVAKPGYMPATSSLSKTFVADILPELTGFNGGINMTTGTYDYTWDAIEGITDYAINVYSDSTMTTKVAALSSVTNTTSVSFDLNSYPLGDAYYVTVVVKNGNFEGTVSAPMAVMAAGVCGGDGSVENPYVIANAVQFKNIFDKSNTKAAEFYTKNYILISDIDLSEGYTPAAVDFTGSLSGWDINENKATKRVIDFGTLEHDEFHSTAFGTTSGYTCVGALFHIVVDAKISNLIAMGSLTSTKVDTDSKHYAGFIGAGKGSTTIEAIDNNLSVTATKGYAGGVIGCARDGSIVVTDCVNHGKIIGTRSVGGITANQWGDSLISKCYNTGEIESAIHAGGIAGQFDGTITECYNLGGVVTTNASANSGTAGIAGYSAKSGGGATISNCWNAGPIESKSTRADAGAGGIVGAPYLSAGGNRYINVENCFNTGVITAITCKGAAIGNIYDTSCTVKGFYDNVNKDIAIAGLSKTLNAGAVIENAFVLGERNTAGGLGERIADIWTIAALKTENDYFKNASVWEMAEGYDYPQLKAVPYVGAPVELPAPPAYKFTSEVKYQYNPEATVYTVSWDYDTTVSGYNVYVGNEKVAAEITVGTYNVPAAKIVTGEEEVTVSAIFEGQEYYADPLVFTYGGGKGTEEDPYLIYTLSHLNNVNLNLGATFKQMVDIEDELTTPIGTHETPFTGKYYGADETNKAVKLNISGVPFAAMFSATQGATIEYVTTTGSVAGEKALYGIFKLSDGTTERPAHATAGLVAITKDSPATNINYCINEANVTLDAKVTNPSGISLYTAVGGIVGYPMTANVKGCKNYGLINAMATSNVGGIAGYAGSGSYTYNVNYGTITNGASLGGVVGSLYATTFEYNANVGSINNAGNSHTGGVVGSICGSSSVKYSYNSGNVTGTTNVGGITGRIYSVAGGKATIADSFNTGVITGTSKASIVADYTRGGELTINNVYDIANPGLAVWNTNTIASPIKVTNAYILNGTNLTNGGIKITEEEAKALLSSNANFTSEIWEVNAESGYPYPVIKGLPYEKVVTIEATTLTINTENGKYILNWNLQDDVTYDVFVGSEKVATGLTTNTFDATEFIEGMFQGDVYVVGNKDEAAPSISNTVAVDGLFAGGKGTEADPYLIATGKQFKNIAKYPSSYYKQTKDIEVTEAIKVNFSGVYDGNGYDITVDISNSSVTADTGFGLFCDASSASKDAPATIKNVTLKGEVTVTSANQKQYVAGIVGYMKNSYLVIDNCVNYATISDENAGANSNTAGILGRGYKAGVKVTNCVNYGTIVASANAYAGGVVGMAGNASLVGNVVENCANYGSVTGKIAGGVMAWTYSNVENCFNMGTVHSLGWAPAGVVAYTGGNAIEISNCFNAGELTTTSTSLKPIAIIASNHATSSAYDITIVNCYNTFDGAKLYGIQAASGKKMPVGEASYNVTVADTATGVTTVTLNELKTLNISDSFTLLSENGSNPEYNKDYVYPQIKTNLVAKDFEVPGAPETLEIKDIYFDEETADWMVKIDPTKDASIATYELKVGNDIILEFEKSDLNSDNAIALEEIAIGETTVSLKALNSSNAPVLTAESVTVDMTYSGGTGSTEDPYVISHKEQFVHFFGEGNTADDMSKSYVLVKDIDLSATDYVPSAVTYFSGTLSGWDLASNKAVKRTINIGDVERTPVVASIKAGATKIVGAGLINTANGSVIGYLKLTGKLTSAATDAVGGLVAYDDIGKSEYNDIENHIDVTATGLNKGGVGGILGFARTGLTRCANYGDVTGNYYVGGLTGYTNSFTPTKTYTECVNYGTVTGSNHTGGLMGSSYHTFIDCANFGEINGGAYTGGIAGYHSQKGVSMVSTFNAGAVNYTATNTFNGVGALVGGFYFDPSNGTPSRPFKEIKNCYNIGVVTPGSGCKGAVVGNIQGTGAGTYEKLTITGCYDLANIGFAVYSAKPKTTSIENGVADVVDTFIIGATDGENTATIDTMKTLTSKTGTAFADSTVWKVDENASYKYPTLVTNPFDDNLEAFTPAQ